MEEGKDGRGEGWKDGRGEGWKDGRGEGWKRGRMEGGKDGRGGNAVCVRIAESVEDDVDAGGCVGVLL